jgi:hypothetical protein
MSRIVEGVVVELDGDEMTRINICAVHQGPRIAVPSTQNLDYYDQH